MENVTNERNWVKEYMGPLCIVFATSCESRITFKIKRFKNTSFFQKTGVKWYFLVVLFCMSLTPDDVEYFLTWLLVAHYLLL